MIKKIQQNIFLTVWNHFLNRITFLTQIGIFINLKKALDSTSPNLIILG